MLNDKELREMAAITGVNYRNLTELRNKADGFLELSNKVDQYLRNADYMEEFVNGLIKEL